MMFRKQKQKEIWPQNTQVMINERVGEWVNRFLQNNNNQNPSAMDFLIHKKFIYVKLSEQSESKENTRMIKDCQELCGEVFDKLDWFLTPDLRLWFSSEDQLITFKLSWNW